MDEEKETEQRRADNEAAAATLRKFDEQIAAFKGAAEEREEALAALQRDPRTPLPLTIPAHVGLEFVPAPLRENYTRSMNGDHILNFIDESDKASWNAYQAEIAAGKLKVVFKGSSPELQRLREIQGRERAQVVHDMLNKQARRVEDAKIEAERKKLQAQIDRLEEARRQHRSV